jgi:predicted DNA-binding protein
MSYTIELPEETYRSLKALATEQGQTPEKLVELWVAHQIQSASERNPRTDPRYYETDEWLRHLGMSDEEIRQAEELAALDEDADADA